MKLCDCGYGSSDKRTSCCKCGKPFASARRVRQTISEIPPGLEWCKDRALQLIARSSADDFDDCETWAEWCRNIAGAGLIQDPARLEMFEKQGGVTLPADAGMIHEWMACGHIGEQDEEGCRECRRIEDLNIRTTRRMLGL